jgi:hypothetical protein
MLVYLAAPYSNAEDKDALMRQIMKTSGEYMMTRPGEHVVSPLFNHYSLSLVEGMGGDYAFWKNYSRDLLRHCDKVIVLMLKGWRDSTGVNDEIELADMLNIPMEFIIPSQAD